MRVKMHIGTGFQRVGQRVPALREHWLRFTVRLRHAPETGASTAEYAMTMLAACAFAGVLLTIIRSSPIKTLLLGVIQKAMSLA